jgi:predicted dinucleotide-binding enzyme
MKIGIIGTGNMGQALGGGWARAGHEVLFGSRQPEKARQAAADAGGGAQAGDFDDAAAFGEVVLYTVRGVYPSKLLRRPEALAGKIVVDCNNRDVGDDAHPGQFKIEAPPPGPTLTEMLAADAPTARVVKAFSTIPSPVFALGRAAVAADRVSVYVCGDDPAARKVVSDLAEALGFVGVDSGGLDRAWMIDGLADFLRFQIGIMGMGVYATISVHTVHQIQKGGPS